MNTFSISELQQFSGIKAHTIRMWEQRYGALQPSRSEGNTRYYDSLQLRRLLNIVSLMNTDLKVSELCSMPDQKLHQLLEENLKKSISDNPIHEHFIAQIIASTLTFDEWEFNQLYADCTRRYTLRDIYVHIFYPVLIRLGLMWSNDSLRPAHEHFITQLMRRKILAATDQLPKPQKPKQTWLLFLPEDEFHETGLLFSEFLIRQAGHNVTYMGSNLPLDALQQAIQSIHPTHLLTFLVRRKETEEEVKFLQRLRTVSPLQTTYIACASQKQELIKTAPEFNFLHAVSDLENALNTSVVKN